MKMNKPLVTISLTLFLALLITVTEVYGEEYCYVPYGENIRPEFIADGSFIKMNWVDGERGMEAFASYMYDEETSLTICVITARMPDQIIGDPDMDSLGHEFLHCVTGDFHEGEH